MYDAFGGFAGRRRELKQVTAHILVDETLYAVGREGCLSLPDYTGNVIRAEKIHLEALDRHGRPLSFDMEGFEARAVQHEMDHLDGLLFLDRLVSRRNDLFRRKVYKK